MASQWMERPIHALPHLSLEKVKHFSFTQLFPFASQCCDALVFALLIKFLEPLSTSVLPSCRVLVHVHKTYQSNCLCIEFDSSMAWVVDCFQDEHLNTEHASLSKSHVTHKSPPPPPPKKEPQETNIIITLFISFLPCC